MVTKGDERLEEDEEDARLEKDEEEMATRGDDRLEEDEEDWRPEEKIHGVVKIFTFLKPSSNQKHKHFTHVALLQRKMAKGTKDKSSSGSQPTPSPTSPETNVVILRMAKKYMGTSYWNAQALVSPYMGEKRFHQGLGQVWASHAQLKVAQEWNKAPLQSQEEIDCL
ncbi:unnamed protein product [Cuscuta campestris]|uniref:Uncharacterized protein n=1 Tax=Cuscuta campestris TaxID=132261 RepID=A0A484LPS5_9ASTE|nr:unnamed protein product [Cuscuta campestris]